MAFLEWLFCAKRAMEGRDYMMALGILKLTQMLIGDRYPNHHNRRCKMAKKPWSKLTDDAQEMRQRIYGYKDKLGDERVQELNEILEAVISQATE